MSSKRHCSGLGKSVQILSRKTWTVIIEEGELTLGKKITEVIEYSFLLGLRKASFGTHIH